MSSQAQGILDELPSFHELFVTDDVGAARVDVTPDVGAE
jgi:hypothetical protein